MKVYLWSRKHRATVNGVLITVFTSLIFNTISDTEGSLLSDFGSILRHVFAIDTLSGFLTFLSLDLIIVFNAYIHISTYIVKKRALSDELADYMKANTSPHLVKSVGNGCLSWGEGKTVEVCGDIIFGWNPENVIVNSYEDNMYMFFPEEEINSRFGLKSYFFNETDYSAFKGTKAFKEIDRKGNNLPRVMLKSKTINFNKKERKLLLSFGRTEWSQTCYVWDRFGKNNGKEVDSNDLMTEYSTGISGGDESEPYLPNSFCMHLLIETLDNKIILSHISQTKLNDNPGTLAATLGEQLDIEDITDGNEFRPNFVTGWMKRALLEEYKFSEEMYADIVNEGSLKVLSVDFESDRYNFSLLCTVQLRYSFDAFYKKVGPTLATEEAIMLEPLDINRIPDILMTYRDPEKRKKYHPSTYLRLLVFLVHRYGYSKAEQLILEKGRECQAAK
jgi:hypothetical protein